MALFLGEYAPTLTEGSRISLPKKLRAEIRGKTIILSKGFDGCIFVYDEKGWEERSQTRIENRRGDGRVEDFERYIYSSAEKTVIDGQGRFVIPAGLLSHAQIQKDVVVAGVGDHMEIWAADAWKVYMSKVSERMSADA